MFWHSKNEKRLRDVEERLENAERGLKAVTLDLGDLWDRFTRLQGRLSKRGELRASEEPTPADVIGGPGPQPAVPRQLEILRNARRTG